MSRSFTFRQRAITRPKRFLGFLAVLLVAVVVAIATAHAGATSTEKCQAAKVLAVGKKVAAKANCYKTTILKAHSVDPVCLRKVEDKFTAAIAKADKLGTCDGAAVHLEADADACIGTIVGDIAPPMPTRLRQSILDQLAGGSCLGELTMGSPTGLGTGFTACRTSSAACTNGCNVSLQVLSLAVDPAGAGQATVDTTFDASSLIDLDGKILGVPVSCSLQAVASGTHLQAHVSYEFDVATGRYRVTGQTIDLLSVAWQLSNCAELSGFGSLVTGVVDSLSASLPISLIGLSF